MGAEARDWQRGASRRAMVRDGTRWYAAVRADDVDVSDPSRSHPLMTRRLQPLLLGLLCLGAAPALSAQSAAPRPITFGLIGGLSSATLRVDEDGGDESDTDRRNGFAGGAFLTFGLAPQLGLRTELLYAMKGAKLSGQDGGGDEDESGSVQLDYVELPILLQFQPAVAGGVRPRLYAGPALALKARCKLELGSGEFQVSSDCEALDGDEENLIKDFDVGAMVGGELAFGTVGPTVAIGVRYTHGLANVSDVSGTTLRNRALGVYGSIEFPLGR